MCWAAASAAPIARGICDPYPTPRIPCTSPPVWDTSRWTRRQATHEGVGNRCSATWWRLCPEWCSSSCSRKRALRYGLRCLSPHLVRPTAPCPTCRPHRQGSHCQSFVSSPRASGRRCTRAQANRMARMVGRRMTALFSSSAAAPTEPSWSRAAVADRLLSPSAFAAMPNRSGPSGLDGGVAGIYTLAERRQRAPGAS